MRNRTKGILRVGATIDFLVAAGAAFIAAMMIILGQAVFALVENPNADASEIGDALYTVTMGIANGFMGVVFWIAGIACAIVAFCSLMIAISQLVKSSRKGENADEIGRGGLIFAGILQVIAVLVVLIGGIVTAVNDADVSIVVPLIVFALVLLLAATVKFVAAKRIKEMRAELKASYRAPGYATQHFTPGHATQATAYRQGSTGNAPTGVGTPLQQEIAQLDYFLRAGQISQQEYEIRYTAAVERDAKMRAKQAEIDKMNKKKK